MKHIKQFENWKNFLISKKIAKEWMDENQEDVNILHDKEKFGTNLTDEEIDLLNKYDKMYDIVHKKEIDDFYREYPLAHTPKKRRKSKH